MAIGDTEPPLRFGVVCPAAGLRAWQVACLRHLVATGAGVLVLVAVAPGERGAQATGALGRLVAAATRSGPLRGAAPGALFDGVERLDGAAAIEGRAVDVVLDFGDRGLTGGHGAARYGIWRFTQGGGVAASVLSCFWPAHRSTRTFAIELTARVGGESRVLRRGVFRSTPTWAGNADMVFGGCWEWVTAAANGLRSAGGDKLADLPVAGRQHTLTAPTWVDLAVYAGRSVVRWVGRQFSRALSHDVWHVGVVRQSRAELLASGRMGEVAWMAPAPAGRYYADPFVLEDGDARLLLVEDFSYAAGRARISQVALDRLADSAAVVPAIDGLHHLSYPFVVRDGDAMYCVPEQGEGGSLTRYRRDGETGAWLGVGTIGPGPVIDGTLVRWDDKWWLFGGLPDEAQYNLRIWFADNLDGPWQAHPLNPVKVDVRSARSAGPFMIEGGRLYRPAQNSATGYGGSLFLVEVTELTTTGFREVPRREILPDPKWPFPDGLHTISGFSGGYVIDAKRTQVSLKSGVYRLLTRWQRLRRLTNDGLSGPAHGSDLLASVERSGR